MKTKSFSRPDFLGVSAVVAGTSLVTKSILLDPEPLFAYSRPVPASDRVRFGMIGVGMQGNWLLHSAIELPGVECTSACDLYDGRHTLAREITRKADLPVTRRYQELLADKSIDCVVAAVPDHWHKQIVVDAVSAGKDIYCEKPMSHTAAEGVEMADAAKRTGRIVQIGSQRVSSLICKKAREMVAQAFSAISCWWKVGWGATIQLGRGNIRRHRISRLRIWIGIPGRETFPTDLSILRFLRAGAAGRNTEPGLPVICWCT